ncbi:MAG: hypothetical protein ACLS9K_03705 [Lachnospira eligens]
MHNIKEQLVDYENRCPSLRWQQNTYDEEQQVLYKKYDEIYVDSILWQCI